MAAPTLARTRILNRIVAALEHGDVCVIAPAGYGKSTLLRLLPGHRPSVGLLAIAPTDADLGQLKERLRPYLAQAHTIVLDDVHHLTDATDALNWLNEQRVTAVPRWVICGRDIPTELLEAKRAAATLRADDLAFGPNEAKALLSGRDEAFVAQWHARLQGWPLALALLARGADGLDLAAGNDISTPGSVFSYLANAIFGQLPSDVLRAARASALPRRFDDALLAMLLDVTREQAQALRQEIQRRALFLEATEPDGWFKYHDAVRDFLVTHLDATMRAVLAEKLIARFEAAGEPHLAIESALDADLPERAAHVLNTHKRLFTHALGHFSSYERWLSRLPEAVHRAWPMLTSNFVSGLSNRDQPDARLMPWVERTRSLLAHHHDPDLIAEVNRDIAIVYLNQRQTQRALEILFETMRLPISDTMLRARVRGTLGTTLATRFELRAAGMMLDEAQAIVKTVQSPAAHALLFSLRHNRANLIDNCIGNFRRAAEAIAINIALFPDKPANLDTCYVGLCATHENLGDWDALENDLDQIKRATIAQEGPDCASQNYTLSAKWEMFYWSALHLGRGEFGAAARMIDAYCAAVSDPEAVICGQWLRAWSLRCQGRYAECIDTVDGEALSDDPAAAFYRAVIGLERAAAAVLAGRTDWIEPATAAIAFHIRLRARHSLLRWRILFALDGHRQGDARWRKHVAFALHELARDGYAMLLIRREPQLAECFWALCVREGIAQDQSVAALVTLKRTDALFAQLDAVHSAEATRQTTEQQLRLINAIAAAGDERAIPVLAALRDVNPEVRDVLARALDHLEAAPPPRLAVTLLGEFGVQRGGALIDPDAWQRPGARQLLQFFCIHRGKRLRREQVLRAVWPNSEGTSALGAFRIAFSRLGSVLEPHLRSRAPLRYFTIDADADTICFDPQRSLVQLDSEAFLAAIADARRADPLNDEALRALLAALGAWRAPLGQSRYADWALDMIEQLNATCVEGCVQAAEALIARGQADDFVQAERWAEMATRIAPWHDAGWQVLLQAVARQGRRGEALRLFTRATSALQRELGAPPSLELQALAKRLRDDATK